jgi:ribosomal protein S10
MIKSQNEHMAELDKTMNDLTTYLKTQSDTVMREMQEHVLTFGKEDRTYMENELKRIKVELDEYKRTELDKINENIYEILARTSETVLGRAVDLDLHQELVIKGLEQAKRDGVFV